MPVPPQNRGSRAGSSNPHPPCRFFARLAYGRLSRSSAHIGQFGALRYSVICDCACGKSRGQSMLMAALAVPFRICSTSHRRQPKVERSSPRAALVAVQGQQVRVRTDRACSTPANDLAEHTDVRPDKRQGATEHAAALGGEAACPGHGRARPEGRSSRGWELLQGRANLVGIVPGHSRLALSRGPSVERMANRHLTSAGSPHLTVRSSSR